MVALNRLKIAATDVSIQDLKVGDMFIPSFGNLKNDLCIKIDKHFIHNCIHITGDKKGQMDIAPIRAVGQGYFKVEFDFTEIAY